LKITEDKLQHVSQTLLNVYEGHSK